MERSNKQKPNFTSIFFSPLYSVAITKNVAFLLGYLKQKSPTLSTWGNPPQLCGEIRQQTNFHKTISACIHIPLTANESDESFTWGYFNFLPHRWFIFFFVGECRNDRMPKNARDVFTYSLERCTGSNLNLQNFLWKVGSINIFLFAVYSFPPPFTLCEQFGQLNFDNMMLLLIIFRAEWENQSNQNHHTRLFSLSQRLWWTLTTYL